LTLALAVSLAGLALFAVQAPTTRAAVIGMYNGPTISASSPSADTISVSGSRFTPGGTVWVWVTPQGGTTESTYAVTATYRSCNPFTGLCSLGGAISVTATTQGCDFTNYYYVQAYDGSSHTYSNRVTVYVQHGACIP
jgi:hypothetical protein